MKKEASWCRGKGLCVRYNKMWVYSQLYSQICVIIEKSLGLWIFVFSLAAYFIGLLWRWSEIMCVKGLDKPSGTIQRGIIILFLEWSDIQHNTVSTLESRCPLLLGCFLSLLKNAPVSRLSPTPTCPPRAKGWEARSTSEYFVQCVTSKSLHGSLRIWLWFRRFVSAILGAYRPLSLLDLVLHSTELR